MNVTIVIRNQEDNTSERHNVYDIEKDNVFNYEDAYGAKCRLFVVKDGVYIDRKADSHHTKLSLREDCYCEVESSQGTLKLEVKVLAFEKKDDSISIAYTVESQKFLLSINFWENI